MDLEQFVASSLMQIVAGVAQAQKETRDTGARIVPDIRHNGGSGSQLSDNRQRPVYDVEFNVAVTATTTEGSGAGMKVRLYVIEAGIGGRSAVENSSISRVSFSVPISYAAFSDEKPK